MHMADIGKMDYLRGLIPELKQAQHGTKGTVIARACNYLSLSKQQVFRCLRDLGYETDRKPRADKGKTKVSDEELKAIAGLLLESTRQNGKRLLSFELAIEMARANNWLKVDISPSRLSDLLAERDLHPDQLAAPSPHVQLQSLHPNYCWQVDPSVCVLYYLKGGKGMHIMEAEEFYKNKPQNIVKASDFRVIRYVCTDHYSGTVYVEYFMGSESAENLTTFFLHVIQKRPGDPFHGVCFYLMIDPGSANTAKLFMNLLDRLDIEPLVHEAGAARVNGSVESSQNIVERQFESRLAFMPVNSLAELNENARAWQLAFNSGREHSRHGHTRFGLWTTIREDQLRIAPDIELCRELVTTRPTEATVRGDLTISYSIKAYGSQDYDVRFIPGVSPKQKIVVVINPYRAPAIDVIMTDDKGVETKYTVEPIKRNIAGFRLDAPIIGKEFAAAGDSPSDRNRKDIREAAYGTAADTDAQMRKLRKAGAIPFAGTFDPMADVKAVDVPVWIPKRGTLIDVSTTAREVAPLNHVAAAKEIQAQGVIWKRQFMQLLEARYPDGNVPQTHIADLVRELGAEEGLHPVIGELRHA